MVKIGETFEPDRSLATLYHIYQAIPAAVLFVPMSIAGLLVFLYVRSTIGLIIWASFFVVFIAVVLPIAYWIPRYVESIGFTLERDRMRFERGVWWKRKIFVPYNRIMNVDIIQRPISCAFGLGKVMIQTAGCSATAGRQGSMFVESSIFRVKNFEEIKDTILGFISRQRPMGVEATPEQIQENVGVQILQELRKISESLETRKPQ